jgi:Zn-finger in ubiquitin-hydrolases and other protein
MPTASHPTRPLTAEVKPDEHLRLPSERRRPARRPDPPRHAPHAAGGCEECLQLGSPWVHLRLCLACGHVGCCDSSPMRHARAHAYADGHAIVQSMEPGEGWRWCYVDETYV